MNVFLDDVRQPIGLDLIHVPYAYENYKWKTIKNFFMFKNFFENAKQTLNKKYPVQFDRISFDFDLKPVSVKEINKPFTLDYHFLLTEERNGYHCLKYFIEFLEETKIAVPSIILLHSYNGFGLDLMEQLIAQNEHLFKNTTIIKTKDEFKFYAK